jgi:hypothetical protein
LKVRQFGRIHRPQQVKERLISVTAGDQKRMADGGIGWSDNTRVPVGLRLRPKFEKGGPTALNLLIKLLSGASDFYCSGTINAKGRPPHGDRPLPE